MLVYRVEHPDDGIGPFCTTDNDDNYRPHAIYNDEVMCHSNEDYFTYAFPSPREEGIPWGKGWNCGCQTRDLVVYWFGGLFDRMNELGYHLVTYEVVKDYRLGEKQTTFRREHATEVAREWLF